MLYCKTNFLNKKYIIVKFLNSLFTITTTYSLGIAQKVTMTDLQLVAKNVQIK